MEKLQYSVTPDASDRWRDSELSPEMQEAIKNLLRTIKRDGGGVAHTVTVYGNVYRLVSTPAEVWILRCRNGALSALRFQSQSDAEAHLRKNSHYYIDVIRFVEAPS